MLESNKMMKQFGFTQIHFQRRLTCAEMNATYLTHIFFNDDENNSTLMVLVTGREEERCFSQG